MMVSITRPLSAFRLLKNWAILAALCFAGPLLAQNTEKRLFPFSTNAPGQAVPASDANCKPDPNSAPIFTTREKWNNFVHETASLLTLGGGTFNAAFSQATDTDPRYGVNSQAFAKRFGASIGDIATQNLFGDFLIASAFHEDPRYFRMGRGHPFWTRVGYAISRAAVIRKDSGGNTFNFDNVLGSGLSTAFSNLYYPPVSRTVKGNLMHWGIDVPDNGFVNLAPEFWPDFRDKVLRWRHRIAKSQ